MPGWPARRGGRPEGYCHRQMTDAVRYPVDNGIKRRAMPSDFPPWPWVYAFFARWRDPGHKAVRTDQSTRIFCPLEPTGSEAISHETTVRQRSGWSVSPGPTR
ncbi:transposase [Streptomyces sp. NPDC086519]|uniref:transposase n=1 Tax=Streptomyces sp. NPDC086519 TaxID=3154863 RepID=UPI00342CAFB0